MTKQELNQAIEEYLKDNLTVDIEVIYGTRGPEYITGNYIHVWTKVNGNTVSHDVTRIPSN